MTAALLPDIERRAVRAGALTHELVLLVAQYGLLIVGANVLLGSNRSARAGICRR